MIDREKVIKGLEHCSDPYTCTADCPYNTSHAGIFRIIECTSCLTGDALELLKEQAQKIIELEEQLRLLEYGDQDAPKDVMMPAT